MLSIGFCFVFVERIVGTLSPLWLLITVSNTYSLQEHQKQADYGQRHYLHLFIAQYRTCYYYYAWFESPCTDP